MASRPKVSTYPEFELWETDVPKGGHLRIINAEDFPREDVLKGLGIEEHRLVSSFGIIDEVEIRERHALMRFLHQQPGLVRWASSGGADFSLPTSGESFLRFNDPIQQHNPYWAVVHTFIAAIDAAQEVPVRLRHLAEALRQSLPLEAEERQMAAGIAERLQVMTLLEGIAKFGVVCHLVPVDPKDEESARRTELAGLEFQTGEVYGRRLYSQSLSEVRRLSYPTWTSNKWHPGSWLGIGRIVRWNVQRQNRLREAAALKGMVVSGFNEEDAIACDLRNWLYQRLTALSPDLIRGLVAVTLNFRYTKEGLEVEIVHVEAPGSEGARPQSLIRGFAGFTASQQQQIKALWGAYSANVKGIKDGISNSRLIAAIAEAHPNFFNRQTQVAAPQMDHEYRYFAVENLYQSPEFVETYRRITDHRSFLSHHYHRLGQVVSLLRKLMEKSDEYGAPLCFPVINDSGHSINFEGLLPVQLLFRLKRGEVVPVRCLPELNGRMIGLTGKHGGGKTETELTIPVNIWLAQSGLPVFGDSFSFNVKHMVGLVFIADRGVGSTVQQLLGKIQLVLEAIEGTEGNRVVVVLDEVGTGTQEAAGLELGRRLLDKLSRSGASVLFSTQITGLAEYAQDNLRAQCFQFDRRHNVRPGIGQGGMEELTRETGLDALLAK